MIDRKYIIKFDQGGTPDPKTETGAPPETVDTTPIKQQAAGIAAQAAGAVLDAAGNLTGFEKDSIDAAADTAANVASQFGPWGQVAAVAIKGANFLSKATGEKYQDTDLDTGSSGFADYSVEGKQFRGNPLNPLAAFTKSGASAAYTQRIQKQQEKFASAKALVDSQNKQNKARQQTMNNVNTSVQAQLKGGDNYSAILAKTGTRLDYLDFYKSYRKPLCPFQDFVPEGFYIPTSVQVDSFQNGGSVIPSGELHKNKHDLEKINPELKGQITHKGIPVITQDVNPETDEVEIVQHAEIECGEVILELSITQRLEKLWKEGTDDAAIEAGKVLAKELITNTEDNTGEILNESKDK